MAQAKQKNQSETPAYVSVDPQEMENFAAMAEDWWNPSGKFKPLHIMNEARCRFIKEQICEHFHRDPDSALPLKGLRILDIGCGGGLLSEPMARLGAQVTGVDSLEKSLKTAKTHAEKMGVSVTYRHGTIEQMVGAGERPYDVVLNMEVIEHVVDPKAFYSRLRRHGARRRPYDLLNYQPHGQGVRLCHCWGRICAGLATARNSSIRQIRPPNRA